MTARAAPCCTTASTATGSTSWVYPAMKTKSAAWPATTTPTVTLRVQRAGAGLNFQRRENGIWTNIFTQSLTAGTTAGQGGIFLSTSTAQNVRVAFDYLLLGDPGNSSDLINNLRITEIMYNPKSGDEESTKDTKGHEKKGIRFPHGSPIG